MHKRSLPKLILFSFTILIVGLLFIEAIFGNWVRTNQWNRLNIIRNANLSFNIQHLYHRINPIATYKRDQFGLRGHYSSPDEIDILTIGGSTTDQRYISEGETWQDVLAAALSSKAKPISVVNAGMDGQTTYGHLKNFEWWFPLIPKLKTSYYIMYIGINDLFISQSLQYDSLTRSRSIRNTIKDKSALYFLYRTLKGIYKAYFHSRVSHGRTVFSDAKWVEKPLFENHEIVFQDLFLSYEERLRLLLRVIGDKGAKAICLTQPARLFKMENGIIRGLDTQLIVDGKKINGVDFYYLLTLMNQTTLRVCDEENAMAFDLANGIHWEDDDFYDAYHNTPKGAKKIGLYLASKLQQYF